jgi:hypothetical protein
VAAEGKKAKKGTKHSIDDSAVAEGDEDADAADTGDAAAPAKKKRRRKRKSKAADDAE